MSEPDFSVTAATSTEAREKFAAEIARRVDHGLEVARVHVRREEGRTTISAWLRVAA